MTRCRDARVIGMRQARHQALGDAGELAVGGAGDEQNRQRERAESRAEPGLASEPEAAEARRETSGATREPLAPERLLHARWLRPERAEER